MLYYYSSTTIIILLLFILFSNSVSYTVLFLYKTEKIQIYNYYHINTKNFLSLNITYKLFHYFKTVQGK